MSADSPTPPGVAIGEVAALLEQAAESWSIDAETAILVGHRASSVEEFHRRAAACRAAASTLDRVAGVLATIPDDMERRPGESHFDYARRRACYEQDMAAWAESLRTALSPTSGGGQP